MRIRLSRDVLLKALSTIQGVVDKKHTMPVLSNFRLQATSERLRLTASDLEVELVAELPLADGACTEPGETTLPARKLLDIIKALPVAALVDIAVTDQKATLRSGQSRFVMGTLPAADFPPLGELQQGTPITLSQQALRRLLDSTAFAMAVQDVRYYLTGTLFEAEEGMLRTVTTDGHRLALAEQPATVETEGPLQAIVPRKAVFELQRLLGTSEQPLTLQFGREMLSVSLTLPLESEQTMTIQFASRLIDGRFPDYRRVLPKPGDKQLVVSRSDWMQTLSRVAILSNEKLRGVLLNFSTDQMQLCANNTDQDEATEQMAAQYQGGPLEMSFNVQYLLDALNVMQGEQVQLSMTEANASALMFDPAVTSCRYVIMPMRV